MEPHPSHSNQMYRIVLTGAESTGKSTLATALASHFKAPYSKEFVRNFVDQTRRPPDLRDLETIAAGQISLEDASLAKATGNLVFHDTNLLSTLIYAKHYMGGNLDWLAEQFTARSYDLYLLCMPDFPWMPDPGQRESDQTRQCLHKKFLQHLDSMRQPYVCIYGSHDERLEAAVSKINALGI